LQEEELVENQVITFAHGDGLICIRNRGGKIIAHADKCAHGRGTLSKGDIEDLGECEGGKRGPDGKIRGGQCIKCPRHIGKFGGGLFFNLEDGSSYVKALTAYYTEEYKIDIYNTKVENGGIYVSKAPKNGAKAP
jgi:nitrite reductase/ring-hydroxylating ferredoxin subunit